jgi:hypothetical protein
MRRIFHANLVALGARKVLAFAFGLTSCGGAINQPTGPDASAGSDGGSEGSNSGADARGDLDAGTDEGGASVDSPFGNCNIQVSNYDQSCSVDSDCVLSAGNFPIQSGNYCQRLCLCGGSAINKDAADQYVADVSRTLLGSGAVPRLACSCPSYSGPCCLGGTCAANCPSVPSDAGEAE